jgi:iron complex outermembrane receptor protein
VGGARLRASYAWQLARDTDGQPLADSPRHLAKLNLATPLAWRGARLGSELLCSGARRDARGVAGGYCVANLTLAVPRVLPRAELSVSAFNLFDKRYADVAGAAFVQPTVARQSRTLYAKLGYGF